MDNDMTDKKMKLIESAIRKIATKVLTEQETWGDLEDRLKKSPKFLKYTSHRVMDEVFKSLGARPKYRFYSFWYEGQYYPIDEKSISKISHIKGVQVVNKLPKDLSKWSLKIDRD